MAATEEKATPCCATATKPVAPISAAAVAGGGGGSGAAKAAVVDEWAVDEKPAVTANAKASLKGTLCCLSRRFL